MIETHLPKADGDGVYTKYLTSPGASTNLIRHAVQLFPLCGLDSVRQFMVGS